MEVKQLAYFAAVHEHRNLSYAASQLSVAQSAISHHIAKLETELGTPLFVRKPRGMEPTAAGNRLYAHARKILGAIAQAEHETVSDTGTVAGDFAVGLPYTVMKGIGLPLMQTILKKYPEVRLSIVEGLSDSVHANLLSADVDLALFYNPGKDRRISTELVLEEQVLCVGKPEIIGASNTPITFQELATLPVLLLRHGASSRALIDHPHLLSRLEANAPLQLNSISGITNGMLAGLGCTIAPKIFVREHLLSGALHARPVIVPELTRQLFLGYRRDNVSSRLFEVIKSLTLDLIESQVRTNEWEADFRHER